MQKQLNSKKIHFIGICGKGMSALALMYKQSGWKVSGSDEGFYDPVASMLKKNKINFTPEYNPKNIPKDANLIIIGKHAKLIPEENEEVNFAFNSSIKIKSLPEALGELARKTENTVIAGSFGKSTVTALLSWCLEKSKKDPSYFIGAVPLGFKTNAKLGKGKNFIMEGDEYPSSNWDKNSKFLYLNPKNLILISAEHDHINVFPTEDDYVKPYSRLISLLPKNSTIVASYSGKNVTKLVKKAKCRVATYGLNEKADYYALNINYGIKTSFDLMHQNKKIVKLETSMLGTHNIENIIAVSAMILEKKMLNINELQKAIKSFNGLSGRIDLKTKKSTVLVYEGFGSSYSKAKSVFDALKLHYPNKKLITIFEPHTFSWRNVEAKKWYQDIFNTSEEVLILPPPDHGATSHNQISFQDIIKEVKKNNKNVHPLYTEKETLNLLKKITKKDDMIVLVTSGSLFGLTISVPKLMEKIFPKK